MSVVSTPDQSSKIFARRFSANSERASMTQCGLNHMVFYRAFSVMHQESDICRLIRFLSNVRA